MRSNAGGGGVACKSGLQASAIRKASLHADHPPMCLKMLCKCTIIWCCNASLCKNVRHYFRHYFVLFTFNSMLSFLFHYVNLRKGELLVNLCVATLIDWGRVTHIGVGNLAIIGSDNCSSPGLRHAIIWTDAGILLIGPSETDFNEILIKNHIFSFKKIYLTMSPDSKVHEVNMGPIWGRQDPGGPQVGPTNFAIWVVRKMAAILSWPPCVNILRPSDAYIHRWFMSSFI